MDTQLNPQQVLLHAFPGIPEDEAVELINSGEMHTYPAGEVLCHEDCYENTFYILLDGEVQVSKAIDHHQLRFLKTLSEGDFFGEMGLIHDAPRAATVTTSTPTTVLEIRKEVFDRLLRNSASLSRAMVREVSRRLRENDALAIEDLRLKAGELANAYQRLAEQEYLRREFLTTIAHELRTPLTAASGYLQIMLSGQMQAGAFNTALSSVSRNVQQINALVNDILFIQEMDLILPHFQLVDIREVVQVAVQAVQERYPAGNAVAFLLAVPSELPLIPGDAKSLERAFEAILDNAIKFSPGGGKVQIEALQEEKHLRVVIRDHGVGIQAQDLPHIFDRFFHTDQFGGYMFRGAGLGLSIARQVVEQHGGHISVISEVGQGTTVTIQLELDAS